MSDDIKRLRILIDTYKLSRPVSPELQQYVIDSRMPDLQNVLRKAGKYTLISWFVILIFSLFRKYGLHVTMIQSKIIAGVTAAAVASGSAAAVYRGAKHLVDATMRPPSKAEDTIERIERDTDKKIENLKSRAQEKPSIPVYKKKSAPAEEKPPVKEQQEKTEKGKTREHNSISDILSL